MCLTGVLVDLHHPESRESSSAYLVALARVDAPGGGAARPAYRAESFLSMQMAVASIQSEPLHEIIRGFEAPRRHD